MLNMKVQALSIFFFLSVGAVKSWQKPNIYCYKEINKASLLARWSPITSNIVTNLSVWLGLSQAALSVWMNVLC